MEGRGLGERGVAGEGRGGARWGGKGQERGNSERDSAALGPSWGLPHPDHSAEGCLPLCTQICHLLYPRSQTPRDQNPGLHPQMQPFSNKGDWGCGGSGLWGST